MSKERRKAGSTVKETQQDVDISQKAKASIRLDDQWSTHTEDDGTSLSKNGVKLLDDKLEEEKRKGLSEEREKTSSKDLGATNILTLNSILSFSTIMQELGCERISQHERA